MCNISSQTYSVKLNSSEFSYFYRFGMQRYIQDMLLSRQVIRPKEEFYNCHRWSRQSVCSVNRNDESGRAYFDNIVSCHNAKSCAVCAPRIMGVRSVEIRQAVHQWLCANSDHTCYMITLTFSHHAADRLQDLLDQFRDSVKFYWSHRTVVSFFRDCGYLGRITSTEIQFSQKNGFHPHQHVLIFSNRISLDVEKLRQLWMVSLHASGLTGADDIAFNIVEARSAEKYLTKISSEMALGNLKEGRSTGHYSPFQLAFEGLTSQASWAEDAFSEYFSAVRGKHFLFWSKGLKKYFGIGNVSDSDICEGASDNLTHFLDFLSENFVKFTWAEKAELLKIGSANDYAAADIFFSSRGIKYWRNYDE